MTAAHTVVPLLARAAAAPDTSIGEAVLFWTLGPAMVVASLGLLMAKKAVHAAIAVAFVMVGLGVFFFAQDAPFLGAVQVFVYAGAVMMLFLFVLMMVGVDSSDSLVETLKGQRATGLLLGLGLIVLLVGVFGHVTFPAAVGLSTANAQGNITALGGLIFGAYVWAFEATSALLITAALGAMVLAHRERLVPRPRQRQLAEQRVLQGRFVTPLPGPGVYARHNAVDTPALLPDGTASELSVSRVLRVRGQLRPADAVAGDVAQLEAELEPDLGEEQP